jgi:hypothetical protein
MMNQLIVEKQCYINRCGVKRLKLLSNKTEEEGRLKEEDSVKAEENGTRSVEIVLCGGC